MSFQPAGVYRFGSFRLEAAERLFLRAGEAVPLPPKAFDVLVTLVSRAGRLVTKEDLLKEVWRDTVVEEANLSYTVSLLRKALGDDSDIPRYIETVPRRGYRFVARLESDARPVWRSWATGLALVIVVAGAVWVSTSLRGRSGATRPKATSLAVLPLANLTGDSAQEYFADGITEALIATLGRIRALGVPSRTSVMRYKGTDRPVNEIAHELDVEMVVVGSVLRTGDRVEVAVQLVEARTDRHLWSGTYERSVSDVLSVQGEIARAIAREISLTLTPEESKRLGWGRAVDAAAYDSYLQGRYHRARWGSDGAQKALHFYLQAIEKDPSLADAHAGLAEVYCAHGVFRLVPAISRREALAKADAAARRALELDETLAEAHAALALVLMSNWEWAGAEREYRKALELNPSSDVARQYYAQFLRQSGRLDEALVVIRRAERLNPLDLLSKTMVGWPLLNSHRYDEALEQFGRVLELDPNYSLAIYNRGLAYALTGRHEEALEAARVSRALMGTDPHAKAMQSFALARAGLRSESLELVDDLKRGFERGEVEAFLVAWPYIWLGEPEQALDWLERSFEARSPFLPNFTSEPYCDPLRTEPRFQALRRKMELG
jgi:TolB-like protein/DNA-binding winged helix-turn-helix (wHTH) protein/Tfp pilus assembly protein PilF